MDDSCPVHGADGPRELLGESGGAPGWKGCPRELIGEGSPLDIFEGKERKPIVFTDLVNLDDVRVP